MAYQPLIRDLLNRFVVSELKEILSDKRDEAKRMVERSKSDKGPVAEYYVRERKHA